MASLLPKTIQDLSNLAIEKCAAKAFELDLKPLMVLLIDHVDERLLNLLAEHFHLLDDEGWSLAKDNKEKREILKSSIEIHRLKGTKYAVERVLRLLNIDGKINEWFEYNGRPFNFKVLLNIINGYISEVKIKKLKELINEYKNVRSWMELIELKSTAQTPVSVVSIVVTSRKSIVIQKENL